MKNIVIQECALFDYEFLSPRSLNHSDTDLFNFSDAFSYFAFCSGVTRNSIRSDAGFFDGFLPRVSFFMA